ncbi:major capsid protein [Neisseria musculi]|uniref:Integral membrane protein n=1 Tax=Neisseria musculi TaxID=1815583 RepID=A0A7H1MDR0_9NEIS|nr:major capsid protein [Neisseria musculi]QNT58478.1 putative integral membrane protein [Neisseria musculi]QNT59150.1 putative integral membrane protein [Neisseria musculi]QNT59775.1 putative integral membrane protein [Neisseria musculi]
MKAMNIARKYGAKTAVAVPMGVLPALAMAEVPEAITTALSTARSDALQVGGIVLGIIAVIFALMPGCAVLPK